MASLPAITVLYFGQKTYQGFKMLIENKLTIIKHPTDNCIHRGTDINMCIQIKNNDNDALCVLMMVRYYYDYVPG